MRYLLLALTTTGLLVCATPVLAQTTAPKKSQPTVSEDPLALKPSKKDEFAVDNVEGRTIKMAENLKLTADQKKKVLALNRKRQNQLDAIRSLNADDNQRRQRREKNRTINEAYDLELKGILTPKQYAEYSKNRVHRK